MSYREDDHTFQIMRQPDSETSSPGVSSAPTSTLTPDFGPGVVRHSFRD
ncbi:hypothetical protein [Bradyrhizobium sp. LTSP885]|nr:hypothetical protein [Bradyrhizobium sp. LTSP885]